MKAVVTGASSGIGRDIARELAARGYELILVARRADRLAALAAELPTKSRVRVCDLSRRDEVFALCDELEKEDDLAVVVNNAGFGLFGAYDETDALREAEMVDVNITAVHLLSKRLLAVLERRGEGHLLNVASSAAFLPGPLMSAYYASKAYVLRYSEALREEVRRRGSKVTVSVLCPGPVKTEFDDVANVSFSLRGLDSRDVARCAVAKMLRGKRVIVPGAVMKAVCFGSRFVPDGLLARMVYHQQKKKER